MPLYTFENIKTGELRDVYFNMNDSKQYLGENGDEHDVWKRVYHSPNASVDSKYDHNSIADFVNKTANKKGSYGDILDKSKELSQKREKEKGFDPIKHKYYSNYSKERNGKVHPELIKSHQEKQVIEVDIGKKISKKT